MLKIICQVDEKCAGCGDTLPKGSWAYKNAFNELYCEECEAVEAELIDLDAQIKKL
jgi:hypothetical protein